MVASNHIKRKKYNTITVDLDRYGAEGVIAWFVFMDGRLDVEKLPLERR